MNGYRLFFLHEVIEELGESKTKELLSSFSSPLNPDVEYFLKHRAIEFSRQKIAPTTLVYASYKNKWVLCGYFAIATKMFTVTKKCVGTNTFKRLKKFGTYNPEYQCCEIPAPLIAQLSKNFNNEYNTLITGDELLKLACDEVQMAQRVIGGKIVYLECEDKPQLKDFYRRNGFKEFAKRNLEKADRDKLSGEYLGQMLKYFDE